MNKIIGIIQLFDVNQSFFVYKDGKEVDNEFITIENIPTTVLNLCDYYQINEIDLKGSVNFLNLLSRRIKKAEMDKYHHNNLIINIIE